MEEFRTETIPENPNRDNRSGCLGFAIDTIETVLLALILFFGINIVSARVRVDKISMLPTLQPGNFMLVNKLAYNFGNSPQRGDVIIFHYPINPTEDYVKRVIGLPGDEVVIQSGEVKVNNITIQEPYISAPPTYSGNWIVPDDQLFVLGDNRNQSSDSHSWGFVPMDFIIGKAILVYWPLDNIKILNQRNNLVYAAP